MKVLIGLDHELLRNGLIQLLKDVQQIEYMVITQTTEEFIAAVKKYEFDLFIVDAELQGAGGLRSILSTIDILPPETKRVFMYRKRIGELERLFEKRQIHGLFYERSSLDKLLSFFQKVISGEKAFMMSEQKKNVSFTDLNMNDYLSKREEEVFHMKVRGYTVKETSEVLNISSKTVENHRRNIKKKLNIKKNSEWYDWGKRLGVL